MLYRGCMINYFTSLLFVVSLFYFSSILSISPINGEDYALTAMFNNDVTFYERIIWVFYRAIEQYKNWNARLGELNAIFQLSLPFYLQLTLSSLSFLGAVYFVASVFLFDFKYRGCLWLIAILVIITLTPSFEVFFWKTVNASYLQPILLSFPSLYYFNSVKKLNLLLSSNIRVLFSSVTLLFLGLSFENVAPALILYMLSSIYLYRSLGRVKLYIPIFFLLVGWLFLMTAKSTIIRTEFYHQVYQSDYANISYIIERIYNILHVFFDTSGLTFTFFSVSFIYLWRCRVNKIELILPVGLSCLVVGSTILSPYTEPRAFLLVWLIMLSYITIALSMFLRNNKSISEYIVFMLSLWSFCIMSYSLDVYKNFSDAVGHRNYNILLAKSFGCKKPIIINVIGTSAGYRYINNREAWLRFSEKHISNYYGCNIKVSSNK